MVRWHCLSISHSSFQIMGGGVREWELLHEGPPERDALGVRSADQYCCCCSVMCQEIEKTKQEAERWRLRLALSLLLYVCVTVVSKLITDRLFFAWGNCFSNCRYIIALPEELVSITETDLWEFQQKISHCRYRFALEFQVISITNTDFRLERNELQNCCL